MDTIELRNETIKSAFNALQTGDKAMWFSQFTDDAELYDDGRKLGFRSFFENAIGNERFIRIDEVKKSGTEIIGKIETKQWGTFNAYFRFFVNEENKIYRLEIGNTRHL